MITTALLTARWRKLLGPRATSDVAEDRILRQVEEIKSTPQYILALRAHRKMLQLRMMKDAIDDNDPANADVQIAA